MVRLEIQAPKKLTEEKSHIRTTFSRGPALIIALVLTFLAPSTRTIADECEAMAGEVAARVPDVSLARRTSVVVFLAHPSVKYASIGCLPFRNFVAVVEGAYPRGDYFDFLGAAGAVVLHGRSDIIREGARRCLRRASVKREHDNSSDFGAFSFVCSADKLSTVVTVQKR
ncbi:hypothetical protein [Bradyrhizobium stylosanthis]|uniref:hypothetical protein n=1 Tax=Bradyrhizobium stylosanthis TaxID=1803665 RepID=UPI0012E720AE|nr:hypothetical protein [Bradyrhizobium stylosanthis]